MMKKGVKTCPDRNRQGLCTVGWRCWGLAFCVEVAPRQGLHVVGWQHGGPCVLCWDGVMVGLAHGESASWVDLARSDRVAVAADLHVAKRQEFEDPGVWGKEGLCNIG